MGKTTHSLYTLVHQRYPNETRVLNYLHLRNESVRCTDSALTYVMNHLKQTIEHRKWLYYSYVILSDSFASRDREKLLQLILNHDLSKFSAIEVLGYGLKFGRKNNIQPLKNPQHIALWEEALQHHYQNNAHHPQHTDSGRIMNRWHLIESVLDMLACRMQRNLAGHADSTTADIFDIPPTYLERYTEKDREKVEMYLKAWSADVTTTPYRNSLAQKMLL